MSFIKKQLSCKDKKNYVNDVLHLTGFTFKIIYSTKEQSANHDCQIVQTGVRTSPHPLANTDNSLPTVTTQRLINHFEAMDSSRVCIEYPVKHVTSDPYFIWQSHTEGGETQAVVCSRKCHKLGHEMHSTPSCSYGDVYVCHFLTQNRFPFVVRTQMTD